LEERLKNHPEYPSLSSVSYVLDTLKISNLAIDIGYERLHEITTPCLAALTIEGGIFVLVKSIKNGFIEWWHSEDEIKIETVESFRTHWQGIILLAESNEESGDENYKNSRNQEVMQQIFRITFITLALVVGASGLYLTFLEHTSVFVLMLLFTKLAGILVSSLLLWHLIDNQNPFLKNVCQINNSTDCNSVLNSEVATIGGILSWSEVGFFYFSGSFIAITLSGQENAITQVLAYLNLLALPYTIFSIYYQTWRIKKWCILCVFVQILLWVEFSLFFTNSSFRLPFIWNVQTVVTLLFSFGIPVIIWYLLQPIFKDAIQFKSTQQALRNFQKNPTIFSYLLSREFEMISIPDTMPTLSIGEESASNTLIVVTNPYCGACKRKHKIIKKLIEENSTTFRGKFIFSSFDSEKEVFSIFTNHLFAIDISQRLKALDIWFEMEKPDFDTWKAKFPVGTDENLSIVNVVEQHQEWVQKSEINYTPTFYVNNRLLPRYYKIEDFANIAHFYLNPI
jgi:uncharacterized membrane protein